MMMMMDDKEGSRETEFNRGIVGGLQGVAPPYFNAPLNAGEGKSTYTIGGILNYVLGAFQL